MLPHLENVVMIAVEVIEAVALAQTDAELEEEAEIEVLHKRRPRMSSKEAREAGGGAVVVVQAVKVVHIQALTRVVIAIHLHQAVRVIEGRKNGNIKFSSLVSVFINFCLPLSIPKYNYFNSVYIILSCECL